MSRKWARNFALLARISGLIFIFAITVIAAFPLAKQARF
jgi:hypothetical protein